MKPSKPLISEQDIANLYEIQRLLDEGLAHYLTYESHCKSSEGYVSIEVSFGTSWDRRDAGGPVKPRYNVNVYSYALGPHRSHDFDYPEDALEAVKEWHAAEMAFDPETMDAEAKAIENIFEMKPVQGGRQND
jgi:hypothetical protein